MKKREQSKKSESVDEQRELRKKFTNELFAIIDRYYTDFAEKKTNDQPTLYPLEILGVLELLKLHFFFQHNTTVQIRILQNQNDELAHDYSYL